MKSWTRILPGVKSIGWIDCRHLPRRVDISAVCALPVAILTDIHPVTFYDEPTCECQTKKDSSGYEDTVSLKFKTDRELPRDIPLAFVVTDVNDESYLVGSLEEPRAVAECTRGTGLPSGDSAGFDYEVKHVSIKGMVPCII